MSAEARFLRVVDTYAGYCQVCHNPRVVARIEVSGWQNHGTICSHCLSQLADEVERRGKGLAVETADNVRGLTAIIGGNGHSRDSLRR